MSFIIRHLDFYTDGSCSTKTEWGGWAAVCLEDGDIIDEQSGIEPYTTNNRMELTAFLSALENVNQIESGHTEVVIHTDSALIANCINQRWYNAWLTNGWRTSDKQEVKNQDLWSRIIALYIKISNSNRINLTVDKVKAHATDTWNKYVDLLAVKRRKEAEAKDEDLK